MPTTTKDKPTVEEPTAEVLEDEPKGPVRRAPNPYESLIKKAAKSGKRYVLTGRYSVEPYEGRKNANEAFTVMAKLHQAGHDLGYAVKTRRIDNDGKTCRITFRVPEAGAAEAGAQEGDEAKASVLGASTLGRARLGAARRVPSWQGFLRRRC
jgi:hypothetical protein